MGIRWNCRGNRADPWISTPQEDLIIRTVVMSLGEPDKALTSLGTTPSGLASEEGVGDRGMLWGNTMSAELATDRQRARFEAVRRRVFGEMRDAAARKRTTIMLPFHVLAIAILAARGAPP